MSGSRTSSVAARTSRRWSSCGSSTRRSTARIPTCTRTPRSRPRGPACRARRISEVSGFGFKWDMGWMHDTLLYFEREPVHRRYHHDELTFRAVYAWTENFMLPLSHDEVVHGKGSLVAQDAGRPLADAREPASPARLPVGVTGKEAAVHGRGDRAVARVGSRRRGRLAVARGSRTSRRAAMGRRPESRAPSRARAARTRRGPATGSDGRWPTTPTPASLAFFRFALDGRPVLFVANLTPVVRYGYRVPVPQGGTLAGGAEQ